MKKKSSIFWIFLLGFLVRLLLTPFWVKGDLMAFFEWGERFWEVGARDFYFSGGWTYSFPTYPPISNLMFAGLYWVWEQKYLLAQMHNSIKLPPAVLIIMIRDWGHWFLLKLPSILADLGLAYLVYKLILEIAKNKKKALAGAGFFLFNPVTIFLSSIWGQTESLVAFFGLLSFYLLVKNRVELSIVSLFLSLYLKPIWVFLLPLYGVVLFYKKLHLQKVLAGVLFSSLIFLATTLPFSNNPVDFTRRLIFDRMLPSVKGTPRASVSAFNLHTTIFTIDRDLAESPVPFVGIPAHVLGLLLFAAINLFSFSFFLQARDKLLGVLVAILAIGLGGVLVLTNMLERYFFVGFTPLVVLLFVRPQTVVYALLINSILFINLIYAYFRRDVGYLYDLFRANNWLVIRVLSFTALLSWALLLGEIRFWDLKARRLTAK